VAETGPRDPTPSFPQSSTDHGRAAPVSPSAPAMRGSRRIESIDVLRGLVMALMALDHVRDHVHRGAFAYDPTDLSRTSAALFLTRWVTHFCAPVFVFLAGTGAFLWARGRSRGETSRYLVTRGLWLVLLELTVINTEWAMRPRFDFFILQVIWALGWSMVALAGLVRLPPAASAVLGGLMIVGHNLLDRVTPGALGALAPLWQVLHVPGPLQAAKGPTFMVMYPLVPWIGVMAVGYAFGALYARPAEGRRGLLLALGAALTLGFVALRALNGYGDPMPWSPQRDGPFTALSFLNCQKYPPSLLFLLMTLGPSLLLLGALERGIPRLLRPLIVFGRVPLFYYVVHLFVVDVVTIIMAVAQFGPRTREVFTSGPPPDFGYGLVVVYAVWIGLVAALYPLCQWYSGVKARSRAAWTSYL
jgi:uncharacterized membrane protein